MKYTVTTIILAAFLFSPSAFGGFNEISKEFKNPGKKEIKKYSEEAHITNQDAKETQNTLENNIAVAE